MSTDTCLKSTLAYAVKRMVREKKKKGKEKIWVRRTKNKDRIVQKERKKERKEGRKERKKAL